MNRLATCAFRSCAFDLYFMARPGHTGPGAFFWEQDITHGYELAQKSFSSERIRTGSQTRLTGLAPGRHPIRIPGWPQRHAPLDNVHSLTDNDCPTELLGLHHSPGTSTGWVRRQMFR